jgi:hypothetical protein
MRGRDFCEKIVFLKKKDGGGLFRNLVMIMTAFNFYGLNGENHVFLNSLRLEQS